MDGNQQWVRVGKYRVDSRLLEQRTVARCLIEQCQAACCGHGVHVDLAHASQIVAEADLIKPHLPTDRHDVDNWFDGDVDADQDFPSGHRVGTQVVADPHHPAGSRCIFLRPDNHCALQAASIAQKRHPWDLKPFYCALFPLILEEDTVYLDDENAIYALGGTCQRASREPIALYQLLKDEMMLALGQEGYDYLCAVAAADSEAAK